MNTTRFERARTALRQWWCGVTGHADVLHFDAGRVMLRCTSCGRDSTGWEPCAAPPRLRYEGDARRHALPGKLKIVRPRRRA